ncbi:MAG: hypothetical protein ACRD44_14370 [Bryobacteraceae bacterium]
MLDAVAGAEYRAAGRRWKASGEGVLAMGKLPREPIVIQLE